MGVWVLLIVNGACAGVRLCMWRAWSCAYDLVLGLW